MLTLNKRLVNTIFFFLCILFLLPACRAAPTALSDESLDSIGGQLATWADSQCTTIWIEGAPVNLEDGNAGGCSRVWWQHPEGIAFVERGDEMPDAIRPGAQRWHEQNQAVRAHLARLLEGSDCDIEALARSIELLSRETPAQEVAAELSCLGEVDFRPVEHGIE